VSLENEPVCESGVGKPYSAFSGKEMQILGQILLVKLTIDSHGITGTIHVAVTTRSKREPFY
jgi:hypothetical protein